MLGTTSEWWNCQWNRNLWQKIMFYLWSFSPWDDKSHLVVHKKLQTALYHWMQQSIICLHIPPSISHAHNLDRCLCNLRSWHVPDDIRQSTYPRIERVLGSPIHPWLFSAVLYCKYTSRSRNQTLSQLCIRRCVHLILTIEPESQVNP